MHDRFRYSGKRALVVGCATGMGAATAQVVSSLGAEVHGIDYTSPRDELTGFAECDLREASQIESTLRGLSGPFDSIFYCAGLAAGRPAADIMKGNFAAARAVVEGVEPLVPRGGAVAIIASTAGLGYHDR